MSRFKGTFIFGANFEVGIEGPLDARQVVGCYSDLTLPATWCLSPTCSNMALYNGMIVAVGSDPIASNNGIYYLCDAVNYTMSCAWIKAGTGSGSGTVSGATNGLHLINSGTTVALGGNLLSGTTINGQNLYEINLIDLSGFHVSGGTTEIMLVPAGITLSHSGTSVSLDSNAGLTYDADYSANYNVRSLPDVGYVTGLTSGLQSQINYISGVTDTKLAISTYSAFTATTDTRLDTIEADYITGATNGLSKVGAHDVCFGGTIANATNISLSSGSSLTFIDNRPNKVGLQYGADYSADFTSNSLITKLYADAIVSGLKPKQAVDVATTGPITLSGLTTIDGITLTAGMRVLVKDQGGVSGNTANGVYSASTGTWGRTSDFDGSPFGEVVSGSYMWVLSGNTNENTSWVLVTPDPITVGSTPLQFALFNHVQDVTAGTGITVTVTSGNHVISLSPATQTCLANAITGVTNCGAGTSICSSKSGNNLFLDTIIGSGCTSISKVGNEIIIFSTGATSGGDLYTYGSPSVCPVGGMCVGTVLTGKTALKILQEILVPELCGVLTAPSVSPSYTSTGIFEIGCTLSQTVQGTFSRGSINPQYCSPSPFRSGCANAYCFCGTGMPSGWQTCTASVASNTNASYTVVSGTQSWGVSTRYDAGQCAIGNAGTVFATALPSGSTSASAGSIIGAFPLFGTCVNITTLSKVLPLSNMATANCVQINLVADSSPNKQTFEIPCAWLSSRPLVGVQQYNTVSSQWEYPGGSAASSLVIWTCSASSETTCCGSTGYCKYVYNSTDRGAVCIRLVF